MTRQQSLIVTVLVALLAGYGFFTFAVKPKREELSSLNKQLSEQQSKLDQARSLLAANQAAKDSYRQAYATVVRLGKAVPGDDDVRSLMIQLSSAARASRVTFQSIDSAGDAAASAASATPTATGAPAVQLPPGATVGPAGFPVMPFQFTFTGKFFRLSNFFAKLNRFVRVTGDLPAVNGRLLTINGIKLEPGDGGFPTIKASVDAESYLVSPQEGVAGGATAAGPAAATAAGTTTPSPSGSSTTATTTATSTGAIR